MTNDLVFSREGRTVVVTDGEGVVVMPLRDGAETVRVATDRLRGVAAFADQIWIVDGPVPSLRRIDERGRTIATPRPLAGARGERLVPIALGPPAATWGPLAIYDDLGTLREHAAPDADVAIPLTARRWLAVRGARVELGNGVCAAVPLRQVTRGEVLCDGTMIALIGGDGDRELVVVTRSSGAVQRRIKLPAGEVRFAARRGVAVIAVEPRRSEVVDLRSGRCLGAIRTEHDVSEIAVDPDGRSIALRHGEGRGGVEILGFDAAITRGVAAMVAEAAEAVTEAETEAVVVAQPLTAAAAVTEGEAVTAAETETVIETVLIDRLPRPFTLHALCPRPAPVAVDMEVARRCLDGELGTVGFRTLLAIANAWDTRRIGYANESKNPFEHEVAALLGMNGGFAAEHVAAAIARLAEHETRIQGEPEHRAVTSPIGILRDELGLSELALDVLMVIAAPALWGETARLFGILANDPSRPLVDELLVCTILAPRAPRHEILRELDSRSSLVRTGAVRIDGDRARPFAGLVVDPVVLARLIGAVPALGDGVEVRPAASAPALEQVELPRAILYTAITGLSRLAAAPARLVIRGRHGVGLRSLCAALAREANRDLVVIDATKLASGIEPFRAAVATLLRQAHLAGHLPCMIHLDGVAFEDRRGRDAIVDVLRAHPGPIALCLPPDVPAPFDPGHLVLHVPVTTEAERQAAWGTALAQRALVIGDVAGLAARYRIGVAAIRRAVGGLADARGSSPAGSTGDTHAELEAFLRQDREHRIGEHARRVDRLATWSSLVLPPDVLDSLRELIGRIRHRRQVFDGWGMGRAMSTSRGLTALFQGQPGTGKTMVAGVVARELGLDLYQVDLSKVVSRWLGETERNLGAVFDAAEEGQCVLLFDEADSLFAKRTEVKSSNDRYANLEVNYLLQRLDSFEGIAILTTNFGGAIDPAFKRRMSFKLSFPFPDEDTREQLWRVHLPAELPIQGELDLAALSRKYQLSGGYIRNACLRAAFLAAQEEAVVTHSHLERAVSLEFSELGKLSSSGALD